MKVLFLDWYKTLSDSLFWEHLIEVNLDDYQKLSNCFKVSLKDYIKTWMRGEYTSEAIIRKFATECGMDYEYVMTEFIKSAKSMQLVSDKLPGLIKKIRNKGIKVVIATDNMDSFTRWTIPALKLDLLFEGILNSWDLKVLKRDLNSKGQNLFFNNYLKINDLKPKDCTIIDDQEDIDNFFTKQGYRYKMIQSSEELLESLSQF